MKLIARAVKGAEFFHSKKPLDMYFAPDSSAQKMCDLMNANNYRLDDKSVWHVYDVSYPISESVEYKLFLRKGILKAKRI